MGFRNVWIISTLIFCLLAGIYLLTFSGVGVTDDEQLFAVLTASLAEGRGYSALPLFGNDRIRGGSGNIEPLGPLSGIPFYLLAKSNDWGRAQALHLPAGIYTALSAALLAAIALRRGYRSSSAAALALTFGLGTIALPYARTNFREPLAMLYLTGAMFFLERLRRSGLAAWKHLLHLAAITTCVGLAALTKLTCGFCLPFFLAAAGLNFKQGANRTDRSIIWMLCLCLLAAAGGLLVVNLLFPSAALGRYSVDFLAYMTRTLPRLPHDDFWEAMAGMLVSPGKGLLIYSPVIWLALFGMTGGWLQKGNTGAFRWLRHPLYSPGAGAQPTRLRRLYAIPERWLRRAQPTESEQAQVDNKEAIPELVEGSLFRKHRWLRRAQPTTISDRICAFGSLAVLMVMQALIYNRDWWGITWSTRALLPTLPLLMLVCLPVLDAALHSSCKILRSLTRLLLFVSLVIQLGRVLIPDPAYVGWLVEATGQEVNGAQQWSLSLMPLWRHWELVLQGIPGDIAWLHVENTKAMRIPLLIAITTIVIGMSAYLLLRKKNPRLIAANLLLAATLGLMPACLAAARYDRRYYGANESYRSACTWLAENAGGNNLVLVDAYLKPIWWFTFNFGCIGADWIGLPYEHTKPISGELYYPRLGELAARLETYRMDNVEIYLLEAQPPDPLPYHTELESYGFRSFIELEKHADFAIYRLE